MLLHILVILMDVVSEMILAILGLLFILFLME